MNTPFELERIDFFTCVGGIPPHAHETSRYETAEEAVDAYLEGEIDPGVESYSNAIRRVCPLSLVTWRRKEVTSEWLAKAAEHAVARALESFEEDFSDGASALAAIRRRFPDEESAADTVRASSLAVAAALDDLLSDVEVTRCEQVGPPMVLDAAACEAMMRKHKPEWFIREGGVVR